MNSSSLQVQNNQTSLTNWGAIAPAHTGAFPANPKMTSLAATALVVSPKDGHTNYDEKQIALIKRASSEGLSDYAAIEAQLDEDFKNFTSGEEDADVPYNPLLGVAYARRVLVTLSQLPANAKIKEDVSFVFECWTDDLVKAAEKERERLTAWIESESESASAWQLLAALKLQLKELRGSLKELGWECQKLGVKKAAKSLKGAKTAIIEIGDSLSSVPSKLPKLVYGSLEWQQAMANSPEPKRGIFHYLDAENWSDRTKGIANFVLCGMMMFRDATGFYDQVWSRDFEGERQRLQRDMMEAVPLSIQERIVEESAQLRNDLEVYYAPLRHSDLTGLTKGHSVQDRDICSSMEPFFNQVLEHFGSEVLSSEQVQRVVDTYVVQRCVQESPKADPTQYRSLGDWTKLWTDTHTATEDVHEAEPRSVQYLAHDTDSAVTSSAGTIEGLVPTLWRTISGWFSFFGGSQLVNTLSESFFKDTCDGTRKEINSALDKTRGIRDQLATVPSMAKLRHSVDLLRRELMKSASQTPVPRSPLIELQRWKQHVDEQCYSIELIEKQIAVRMEPLRAKVMHDMEQLEATGGKKYAKNVVQKRAAEELNLSGVAFPSFTVFSNERINAFLEAKAPAVYEHRRALEKLYAGCTIEGIFTENEEVLSHLQDIKEAVRSAILAEDAWKTLSPPQELLALLDEVGMAEERLMLRSSGDEDSKKLANAGGNESPAYVLPTPQGICEGLAETVCSFLSPVSIQNRINAAPKTNPFSGPLKAAVMVQRLIGEPIGGAKDPNDIPISAVLFSNEPMYIGGEKFRVMTISATYGHGEAVVKSKGIANDRVLLLISEVNPDNIYILYNNRDKPERLAPMQGSDGKVALERLANPSQLRNRPALSDALLRRLYHYAVTIEALFQDEGSDYELVIKRGKIHFVQVRPATGDTMLPTYLDLRELAKEGSSPISQTLQAEELVVGHASVLSITNPKCVLNARTLDEAEKLYNSELHQLVVVQQEEPENSHAVINFKNLGVPCLVLKDSSALQAMLSKVDKGHSLAVCVQTSALHLWDSSRARLEKFVVNGLGVHPAKILVSIPTQVAGPSIKPTKSVAQDVKDLFYILRDAKTPTEAQQALVEVVGHSWVAQALNLGAEAIAKLTSGVPIHPEIRKRYQSIAAFHDKLQEVIAEAKAAIANPRTGERLKPLFHGKALQSLVIGRLDKGGSIGQFSIADIAAINKDIVLLTEYQEGLGYPPQLIDLVLAGNQAITNEGSAQWRALLRGLEAQIASGEVSENEVVQFRTLVTTLERTKALPSWLTFFFPQILRESATPREQLTNLIQTLSAADASFIQMQLEMKNSLVIMQNQIDSFGDPDAFPEVWESLQHYASSEVQKRLTADLQSRSPLERLVALATMKQLTDTYDDAIKVLVAPNKWTDEKKVPTLKQMLIPFLSLMMTWCDGPVKLDERDINYFDQQEKALERNPGQGSEQLLSRPEFDVSSAVLSAGTRFWQMIPRRLAETWTTIHQNLLDVVSNGNSMLLSVDLIQKSHLTPLMKEAIQHIEGREFFSDRRTSKWGIGKTTLVALDVNEQSATAKFNLKLENHSGQLILIYDKDTEVLRLEGKFIGAGVTTRWATYTRSAQLLSDLGILPLISPTRLAPDSVSVIWPVVGGKELEAVLTEYQAMATYATDDDLAYFEKLFHRHTESQNWNAALRYDTEAVKALSGDAKEQIFEIWRKRLYMHNVDFPRYEFSYQEAIDVAVRGASDSDSQASLQAFILFADLIFMGKYSNSILELMYPHDYQDKDGNRQKPDPLMIAGKAKETFHEVCAKMKADGLSFDVAIHEAVRLMTFGEDIYGFFEAPDMRRGLDLFATLHSEGIAYQEFANVCVDIARNVDKLDQRKRISFFQMIEILENLVSKGYVHEEAAKVTELLLLSDEWFWKKNEPLTKLRESLPRIEEEPIPESSIMDVLQNLWNGIFG